MHFLRTVTLIFGMIVFCSNAQKTLAYKSQLITQKNVLGLSIGGSLPDHLLGYDIVRSFKDAGEGEKEPLVTIEKNGSKLLQVSFQYNETEGRYGTKIREILITDSRFQTEKGISVGSTISDFFNAYPNYKIWHTIIRDMMVIQQKNKEIQFIIDKDGYTGNNLYDGSELTILKKSDFSQNTKITKIRLY